MITVKFFASCAEAVGTREKHVQFRPTPFHLLDLLPELKRFKDRETLRVAVNREWADWDTALSEGDEVALLPPLSGG
jgi:sulfur-carrier protein